ncbi:MAG: hypothetical protein IPJ34_13475 [Myxococcales bacterium]|nr:hypothetical protein [Myxococcales bacterium]
MQVRRTPRRSLAAPPIREAPPVSLLHRRWIVGQILAGRRDQDIARELGRLGLPCPGKEALAALRQRHHWPKGLRWSGPRDDPRFSRVIAEAGLRELVEEAPTLTEALAVLGEANGRAREFLEAATIVEMPAGIITAPLAALGLAISAAAIVTYTRYFFDTAAYPRSQLRLMVRSHVRHGLAGLDTARAIEQALRHDPRVRATTVPAGKLGWLAISPSLMAPESNVRALGPLVAQMQQLAAVRVVEALLSSDRHAGQRAAGYTQTLAELHELSAELRDPTEALKGMFPQQIRLRSAETRAPLLAEFTARGDQVSGL